MVKGLEDFIRMFQAGIKHTLLKPLSQNYHVFISYCHRNTEKALAFLKILQRLNPDMNIFYDRIELKAGWCRLQCKLCVCALLFTFIRTYFLTYIVHIETCVHSVIHYVSLIHKETHIHSVACIQYIT